MSCLIDKKQNMRVLKRAIKLLSDATKSRISVRINSDNIIIHSLTPNAGIDVIGKVFIINQSFFKEFKKDNISSEIEIDGKLFSQSLKITKEVSKIIYKVKYSKTS